MENQLTKYLARAGGGGRGGGEGGGGGGKLESSVKIWRCR